ncbi:hypothetical protein GCM10010199_57500 [Dactylosporangium roseum]
MRRKRYDWAIDVRPPVPRSAAGRAHGAGPAAISADCGRASGLIESGEMTAGARLPSEAALVEQHRVARGTARQALAALRDVTVSVQGKGRFVKPR